MEALKAVAIKTYMDDCLLAADHTLIRCSRTGESVTVPSRAGGLRLTEAGSGAIVTRNTKRLTLEEGYIRLNAACVIPDQELAGIELPATVTEIAPGFLRSAALQEIELCQWADGRTIGQLRAASFPLKGGQSLFVPALTGTQALDNITAAAASLAPPLPALGREMCVLFEWEDGVGLTAPRTCYDLTGRADRMDECTAVMDMIRAGDLGWQHLQAERRSDYRIKSHGFHIPWGKLCFALCPTADLEPGAGERLKVRLIGHKLFTPRLLPIRWQGRQYYLYSRNHLAANRNAPYWREDVGVFDGNGLVTEQSVSEAVYAKARLLMFL